MEQIRDGKYTKVFATDKRTQGNAYHKYLISVLISTNTENSNTITEVEDLLEINFQNGPIKEAGVNGVMNEDLIAIVIDRLQGFQASQFACRENALALTKLEEALMWLEYRTAKREKRGVEGTHIV